MYEITCPYCFFKFPHDKVIFRANTKLDASELEQEGTTAPKTGLLNKTAARPTSTNPNRHFRKFDLPDSTVPGKNIDGPLVSFWQNRGGPSAYPKGWEYPHIDPSKRTEFNEMVSRTPVANLTPGEDGLVRDKDGFVKRVIDTKSDPTIPMTRLCPSCHNPMPLQEYGKYPVIFISVVGVTGAGKTVFLNQLLTRFSDAVEHTNFRLAADNLDEIGEAIQPSRPLPESTDAKIVRPPLAALLMRDKPVPGKAEGVCVVFYDIAGDNCVNSRGEPDAAKARTTIGNYIAFSDGLIFLIDPAQLPPLARGREPRASDIAQVVNVMNQIRADTNLTQPQWDKIPVAVTIAKSDKFINNPDIPRDHPIYRLPDEKVHGYNREENMDINQFLFDLLDSKANATVAPLNAFRLRNYFAVSAITCGVESRFIKYRNQYILDSENERKFQDLRRWVADWNVRSPEDRQYYRKCNVLQLLNYNELTCEGEPARIEFDVQTTITKEIAEKIITEIRGDSVDCPSIHLTLWDVAQAVNLVGYPMSEPAPRRVEDPLKWILWQLEEIGPSFPPREIPKRGFLMSQRRYETVVAEVMEANRLDKAAFYGRDPDIEF